MTMSLSETRADAVGKLPASLISSEKISCSTISCWAARRELSSDPLSAETMVLWDKVGDPLESSVLREIRRRVRCRLGNTKALEFVSYVAI
jgi:hypothetical protein